MVRDNREKHSKGCIKVPEARHSTRGAGTRGSNHEGRGHGLDLAWKRRQDSDPVKWVSNLEAVDRGAWSFAVPFYENSG